VCAGRAVLEGMMGDDGRAGLMHTLLMAEAQFESTTGFNRSTWPGAAPPPGPAKSVSIYPAYPSVWFGKERTVEMHQSKVVMMKSTKRADNGRCASIKSGHAMIIIIHTAFV
jgi:hypothetical protein